MLPEQLEAPGKLLDMKRTPSGIGGWAYRRSAVTHHDFDARSFDKVVSTRGRQGMVANVLDQRIAPSGNQAVVTRRDVAE
ncbi:hypothetical protein D3C87_1811890 [compost metagenome]